MYLAGIISEDGVIDGALAARTRAYRQRPDLLLRAQGDGEPKITVTQNDVAPSSSPRPRSMPASSC
jgi:uncharacterized 2Fe-2S/4Fe-4S cluster protein (DUF4445 family)